MIKLGMLKQELTHQDIRCTTFHPHKDEWWVVGTSEGQPCLATFTNGVCTDILVFKSFDKALEKFTERWRSFMNGV